MTPGCLNRSRNAGQVAPGRRFAAVVLALLAAALPAFGALRCDVFPGLDGVMSEGCWAPVTIEVQNDGPPFIANVVLTSSSMREDQSRSIVVELPTGTIKRFIIPTFATTRYNMSWSVRVFDENGRTRFEQDNYRPRVTTVGSTVVLGALARTAAGVPVLPKGPQGRPENAATTARLLPALFPDNPIVLESLSAVYLNTEQAAVLKPAQLTALLGWLHAGGHLIVGIEQPGDLNVVPRLKDLLPFEPKEVQTVTLGGQFREWVNLTQGRGTGGRTTVDTTRGRPVVRSEAAPLPADPAFDSASLLTVTGVARGEVLVKAGEAPLVVQGTAGRGRITALCFSPEREPFKTWRSSGDFWGALLGIPPMTTEQEQQQQQYYGNTSTDGVWGAMVETKQVHKLPVFWLLLILVGYLAVIGPLDQIMLKRMNRQMLTWITFPLYVLAFSLLIYFIGYKLRAGESEWNEINVVDILPAGEKAELRGRTYASLYSPANQRYDLQGKQRFAAVRPEFMGGYSGNADTESLTVQQAADAFKAKALVPVWTSRLFVSDWWQPAETPLRATLTKTGNNVSLVVENKLREPLKGLRVAINNRLLELGDIEAGRTATFPLNPAGGVSLVDDAIAMTGTFQQMANQRRQAFGGGQISMGDPIRAAVLASVIGPASERNRNNNQYFSDPGNTDLVALAKRGDVIVFAWVEKYSPVESMNQFKPLRTRQDTLLRLAVQTTP